MSQYIGLIVTAVIFLIAYAMSNNRTAISGRLVVCVMRVCQFRIGGNTYRRDWWNGSRS